MQNRFMADAGAFESGPSPHSIPSRNPMRSLGAWLLCAISTLVLATPTAHAAPGDLDAFRADSFGTGVYATAVQPGGKILVAGKFSVIGGQGRYGIARLNANGTVDTSFNANLDPTLYEVFCVAVQPDGKILIGGNCSRVAGGIGHE